jgi:hypothetical protein
MTSGTVLVALRAACIADVPESTMTSTLSSMSSSMSAGNRLTFPSAQR